MTSDTPVHGRNHRKEESHTMAKNLLGFILAILVIVGVAVVALFGVGPIDGVLDEGGEQLVERCGEDAAEIRDDGARRGRAHARRSRS